MPGVETQKKRYSIDRRFVGIFVLYFFASLLLGKLSLELAANQDGVAIIWLPAGVALVGLVFIDMRLWPSIALSSFVSNFYNGLPIEATIGIAIGSTLGAITSAYALRAIGPWEELSIFSMSLKFGTIGATISSIISASLGIASLYFVGILSASDLSSNWVRWLIGDWMGIFLFSSFMLIYHMFTDGDDATR